LCIKWIWNAPAKRLLIFSTYSPPSKNFTDPYFNTISTLKLTLYMLLSTFFCLLSFDLNKEAKKKTKKALKKKIPLKNALLSRLCVEVPLSVSLMLRKMLIISLVRAGKSENFFMEYKLQLLSFKLIEPDQLIQLVLKIMTF